jgi:hypothetical protein
LSLSSKKYGFGIWDSEKPIPNPGSRGLKGTGSGPGSATLLLLFDSVAGLDVYPGSWILIFVPSLIPDIRFNNNKKEEGDKCN